MQHVADELSGRRCAYDPAAFTCRGIDHAPLAAAAAADSRPGRPDALAGAEPEATGRATLTLAAADGILARLAAGGGAVAVHGGGAGGGPQLRGLLAACLVRRGLFDARAAVAWLHLAWPTRADPTAAAALPAAAVG